MHETHYIREFETFDKFRLAVEVEYFLLTFEHHHFTLLQHTPYTFFSGVICWQR